MANPKTKEVVDLEVQKGALHSIKALGDSQGGKELVSSLLKDIVGNVRKLIADGTDHVVLVAEMKAQLSLVEQILGAETDEEQIDELIANALRE